MNIKYLLILLPLFIWSCSSTNKYMEKGSEEYNTVTKNFDEGSWYLEDETKLSIENLPGTSQEIREIFTSATVDFEFDTRKVTFLFEVKPSFISSKLHDWKKDYPDLKVDTYSIEIIGNWYINEDGDIIYIEDTEANIMINGSGENFDSFYAWERSKYEMSKSASDTGGLMGIAAGALSRKVTGTSDLFVSVNGQFNIEDFNESTCRLDRPFSKDKMFLVRTD